MKFLLSATLILFTGCVTGELWQLGKIDELHQSYQKAVFDEGVIKLEIDVRGAEDRPIKTEFSVSEIALIRETPFKQRNEIFAPVERGNLSKSDHAVPISITTIALNNIVSNPILHNLSYFEFGEDVDRCASVDLKSDEPFKIISYDFRPEFILRYNADSCAIAFPGPTDNSPKIERRDTWSYPLLVFGLPVTAAVDLALLPFQALGALLHVSLMPFTNRTSSNSESRAS